MNVAGEPCVVPKKKKKTGFFTQKKNFCLHSFKERSFIHPIINFGWEFISVIYKTNDLQTKDIPSNLQVLKFWLNLQTMPL